MTLEIGLSQILVKRNSGVRNRGICVDGHVSGDQNSYCMPVDPSVPFVGKKINCNDQPTLGGICKIDPATSSLPDGFYEHDGEGKLQVRPSTMCHTCRPFFDQNLLNVMDFRPIF